MRRPEAQGGFWSWGFVRSNNSDNLVLTKLQLGGAWQLVPVTSVFLRAWGRTEIQATLNITFLTALPLAFDKPRDVLSSLSCGPS